MEDFDVRLRHPFTSIVSGPTMSGKTSWISKLLGNMHHIDTDISDIVLCYGEWQPAYEKLPARFIQGMIDPDELDASVPHLVIIDDLMDSQDKRIETFFTRIAHHRNCSVIYIVQNLFNQSKGHRTCSLNCQYLIVFKSPRDVSQIRFLERQMFPGKKNFLIDSYNDATEQPYHCLFIDLKPDTPTQYRIRGRVLDEESQDVYVPKDYKHGKNTSQETFTTSASFGSR